MKALMTVLFLAIASSAYAAPNLGTKVDVLSSDARPVLAVYATGDGVFGINMSFWGNDLSQGKAVYDVSARLWNSKTQTYIGSWQSLEHNATGVWYPGTVAYTFSLNGDTANAILASTSLESMYVVFSVNGQNGNPSPTNYFDLSSYCQSYPDAFVNYTTSKTGCK